MTTDARDTVTVLHAKIDQAKTIQRLPDGMLTTSANTHPRHFTVESVPVESLSDLHDLLDLLQHDTKASVIRGALIDGVDPADVLRRKQGDGRAFEAASRRWLMIDIDDLPLSSDLSDVNTHADAIIALAIDQLPAEFHNAACIYQWSSSMVIKPGKVRVHLWFWLDRPIRDAEAKAWLQSAPVDLNIYDPVQTHFTANPSLEDGIADPIRQRVGLYRPQDASQSVSVPSDGFGSHHHTSPRRPHRRFVQGDQIDTQELVRDEFTGLVIDGRERFLLLKSNDAASALLRGRKPADLSMEEIASETWARFKAEADLSDGKYCYEDAVTEATRRLDEIQTGTFPFKANDPTIMPQPVDGPHYEMELVDKRAGEALLDDALTEFFDKADDGYRMALRITTGAGKTHRTIAHLQAYLAHSYGKQVEVYVPRHDLAEEYVEAIQSLDAPFHAHLVHVRQRLNDSPDTPDLCLRPDYVRSLRDAKVGIFHNACRSNDGEACIHYHSCPYISQFNSPDTWADDSHGNIVRIYVHQHLSLPRNPLQTDPDVVIIDEAFLEQVLDTSTQLTPSQLKQFLVTGTDIPVGRLVFDALEQQQPALTVLREAGVTADQLRGLSFDGVRPNTSFSGEETGSVSVGGDADLYRTLCIVTDILAEEMERGRDQVSRIVYDPHKERIRISRLKYLEIPDFAAVLCLDATADEILLEKILGPVEMRRIDIHQQARVTQVIDRVGSQRSWVKDQQSIDDLALMLNTAAKYGERPLLVTYKRIADALRRRGDMHPGVQIMHFGALRGSNLGKDCTVAYVVGRYMPPPAEIDLQARGLFWDDDEPLQHDAGGQFIKADKGQNLPMQMRGYVQSAANTAPQSAVPVRAFSDARIDALLQQKREAETIQALGRLRLVHVGRTRPVYLFSNLPVEIPVDRFVSVNDVMPDTLERAFLEEGSIPATAIGLWKLRSDLVPSEDAAKKLVQRSKLGTDQWMLGLPAMVQAAVIRLTFAAENEGRIQDRSQLYLVPPSANPDKDGFTSKLPVTDWVQGLQEGGRRGDQAGGWRGVQKPRLSC